MFANQTAPRTTAPPSTCPTFVGSPTVKDTISPATGNKFMYGAAAIASIRESAKLHSQKP